jgi:alkanesulfonate monooxygenase SsuD/methylene tetrahydromethanopterin reductase-like flavin-dependent oxidoreductase (luciferase family)
VAPVHFGISLANQHPRGSDLVAGLAEQLTILRRARDLGWDSVWTGQHFLVSDLHMLQPVPYLARLAADSGDMQLGVGIALIALTNPVQLAEDLASLDVVSGGRLVVGVGLGYKDDEYRAFGIREDERVRRLVGNLDVVKQLWSGQPTSVDLGWCVLDRAVASVLPVQRPRPPIWMAAHVDAAVRRAGRLADAWFVSPHVTIETARRQLAELAAARRQAGLPPVAAVPLAKEVYCAESAPRAVELAGPYITGKYRSYARWGQDAIIPEDVSFTAEFGELARDRFVVGSPDDCIAQLRPLVRDLGVTHLMCRMTWPGMPVDVALLSVELFSRHVIPALRE